MANLTLAPEDDDADHLTHDFDLSPKNSPGEPKETTELERLRGRFNPQKVGFGLRPWPGTDQSAEGEDTVTIATRYLMSGKDLRKNEGKK
jgi:hypothetical protein